MVEMIARAASQTPPSYAGVGENVSFPDFPRGTGVIRIRFQFLPLIVPKAILEPFFPLSLDFPPSLRPFFPSSIYVSRIHLAISIKMREKSRDRTRLSNESIVYRGV